MSKNSLTACGVILLLLAGCTASDALFNVFGDHYTGGGTTRAEKKFHYNQQIESAQSRGSLTH